MASSSFFLAQRESEVNAMLGVMSQVSASGEDQTNDRSMPKLHTCSRRAQNPALSLPALHHYEDQCVNKVITSLPHHAQLLPPVPLLAQSAMSAHRPVRHLRQSPEVLRLLCAERPPPTGLLRQQMPVPQAPALPAPVEAAAPC